MEAHGFDLHEGLRMSTAAIVAGGIASAGIGAAGSIIAGSTQASAAEKAQQLQANEAAQAQQFQEEQYNTEQKQLAPFVSAGQGAIGELAAETSTPGEGLLTPWTGSFTPPTAAQAEATPGYAFTVQQGEQALQDSAAASGGLLTGGTAKATTNYAENLASTNYQNTFANALTQYNSAYNTFLNNQNNTYARLAGVAQGGQQATTNEAQLGQQAATGISNINLTTGQQQGANLNLAGAANASGYVGAANAGQNALSNTTGLLSLQQLLAGNSGTVPGAGGYNFNTPIGGGTPTTNDTATGVYS
jgi:hypothetical protein